MKKSIFYSLMSLAALLFCSTAFAAPVTTKYPVGGTWPDAAAATAAGVVRMDTIYMCQASDSLRPLEFGYDVSGLRLHPTYGDWTLQYLSETARAEDYAVTSAKNGGAGNAFVVVNSSVGGYIFEFKANTNANNTLCGIEPAEKVWVYVFLMPNLGNLPGISEVHCVKPAGNTAKPYDVIAESTKWLELYTIANFDYEQKIGSFTYDETVVGLTEHTDTIKVSPKATNAIGKKQYTCGAKGLLIVKVKVVDSTFRYEPAQNLTYCKDDTIAGKKYLNGLGAQTPYVIFNRPLGGDMNGRYAPAVIGAVPGTKSYEYSYDLCGVTPVRTLTVTDVITITDGTPNSWWGIDSTTFCRMSATTLELMDPFPVGPKKPFNPADYTGMTFVDRGSVTGGALAATQTGAGSLVNSGGLIDFSKMKSNMYYYYQYRFDPSIACFGADSGRLAIMLTDPFKAVDFRAQFCKPATWTKPFDLNAFSSIEGATWSYVGNLASDPAFSAAAWALAPQKLSVAQLTAMGGGVHKLKYSVSGSAAACGGASSAVMYIKIGEKVSIPKEITVKYCANQVPVAFNLNEIIGYHGDAMTAASWVVTSVTGTATASMNTANFIAANYLQPSGAVIDASNEISNVGAELIFTLTDPGCIGHNVKVTIKVVSDLTAKP